MINPVAPHKEVMIMSTRTNAAAATALAGALLLSVGLAAPANAQPQVQDGLVNVAIGDVTILEDVNIGVAAQIAANVCGLKVGPIAVLARTVDRSGETTTVCETGEQTVDLIQN
ncbi:hypothetical protein [Agromyces ramosus]|uniref:Uncharacterized protein n=1 Tax=Agromyces ramosus TaxID=33879 RepID=A0ABU0R5F2_9MICO|nr:hypothetical protein [Agromyces ramosus]MDQ0893311.1 hypothetical protein [Agromyces ramosus]